MGGNGAGDNGKGEPGAGEFMGVEGSCAGGTGRSEGAAALRCVAMLDVSASSHEDISYSVVNNNVHRIWRTARLEA